MRFGEAAHPGPTSLVLGTLHPTGLSGKHGVISQLPSGIYTVAESHLPSKGVVDFNRGLKLSGSEFRFLPGASAPLPVDSAVTGSLAGVGVLTDFPGRSANHAWAPELWDTARLHVANGFVQPTWILVGAIYGFATGCPSRSIRLLEELSNRMLTEASGPRMFGGDFNLTSDQVALEARWKDAGFVEVQELWRIKTGQELRVTCKGSTRKDFLWLSHELAQCILEVDVQDSWFADHGVIMAKASMPDSPVARPVWKVPRHRDKATFKGCSSGS